MKSVALLSGGLDSVVGCKRAADETKVELALTFDYGQPAAEREVEAAGAIAKRLGISQRTIKLAWLGEMLPEGLKGKGPEAELGDEKAELEAARAVWVPNRNGVFINVAAAFAEVLDCDQVVAGFNAEEGASFPDNSQEYIEAANAALEFSTLRKPRVVSYTAGMNKAEILRLGRKIGAPLELIWSCYYGGKEMCGECLSCRRVLRALREEEADGLRVLASRFKK